MNRWTTMVTLLAALSTGLLGCPEPSSGGATPEEDEAPDWAQAFTATPRFDPAIQSVVIDLKIRPGFHAYTVGEQTGRPLALTVDADGAFALSGDVQYPKGEQKDLPIGRSVIVEGTARVVGPVARRDGAKGSGVKGSLQYQVCTDSACDRPRKMPFAVKATPPPGP